MRGYGTASLPRFEGVAVFVSVSAWATTSQSTDRSVLAVLTLAPELSMRRDLTGPHVGSPTYNVVHTYVLPLALGSAGLRAGSRLPLLVVLIWIGHMGADRAFGYGLKFGSGF
ncbi:DUF4260 family protein [Halalkalicoccus ordinarius]|uniref:DUF4260 family protein n=1 Tax=Halalkalicoccus ordinarius TaxID=3116651 RepID=UPI00300F36B0